MAYLDENGLARFKSKLDDQLDERIEEQSEETSVLLTGKLNIPANVPQGKFLQTNENGEAVWGDGASSAAVTTAVNNWLADNVAGGSTIAVDTSLNVTGAAAESKTVGTKLNNQILVQDSQPASADNKIWVKETPQTEVEVPTYAEFTDLNRAINDVFDKETVPATIDEITGIVKRAGFSGGAQTSGRVGIKLTANSGYDSYYIITDKPIAIAFNNPTVAYLAMCVAENYTGIETDSSNNLYLRGDNPQRYRKSDDTLPTLDDPLNVPAGAVISFSMTAGATETVYGLEEKNFVKEEFANAIGEIIGAIELRPTIKYLSTVDTDIGSRGKEQLSIFLPTHNGFIKYAFVRCEYDSYNANNWRIDKCYACGNMKNVLYPITASGEWEMAIKINGAPDFIGGNAHGDEVLTAFNIFIDGVLIADVSTITEQAFDVVKIIETTLLYNPMDGATLSTRGQYTPIGTHGREYTITRDGIQLKQEVTFDTALTLAASYMTMLPIIRGNDTVSALQITDHYYADNNYTVYDVSVGESGNPGYGWKFDVEQATIWGNDSGINATVKMLKQPMIDNMGARRFQVQDTLNAYNKFYWSVCGVGGNTYDVSQNERFVTESLYMINRR